MGGCSFVCGCSDVVWLQCVQDLTFKLQNLEQLYVTYARRYDLHPASIAILHLRRLPVRLVGAGVRRCGA